MTFPVSFTLDIELIFKKLIWKKIKTGNYVKKGLEGTVDAVKADLIVVLIKSVTSGGPRADGN